AHRSRGDHSAHDPERDPRGRAAPDVTDDWNAIITEVEPRPARPGPLQGKRLLVKDLIDTAGIRTTYGSKIYADHVPDRTASAVQRLVDAGAVIVGKANLHEFAWGVTSQNPWYGTVQNPAHPGRTTGGSSGGNAAALAAGLCDLGLGTDTGCSIRLPASCCGLVGLKPSWGRIAADGVFPLCPTFDTVGPMAHTVAEVALAWSVLAAAPLPEPRLSGLTVGVLTKPPSVGGPALPANRTAEQYVERLEHLGARVVAAEIPEPADDTWPLFFQEAAESHRSTFPERAADYGGNVRAKLEHAQTLDPAAVAHAREAVATWRRYRPPVDLYVAPVLGVELPPVDCEELDVRIPLTAFLRPFNVLGWAALAIGDLQLIAPRDEIVLAAGLAWENAEALTRD
ncbi:MAG TPA: amidase, partial [Gaiellaceae bacterium]|nr:amidase [Gaiellaceae bacterium]